MTIRASIHRYNAIRYKNRKNLSIADQKRVLDKIDKGIPYREIVQSDAVSRGLITAIKKRREDIIQKIESNQWTGSLHTSHLSSQSEELDRLVLKWFREARARGIPVSGPLLKSAAKCAAEALE